MIINVTQNLLTHFLVDLISTVEMLKIFSVVKSKSHKWKINPQKKEKKPQTHASVCRLWFPFHWMSERN